MKKYGNRCILGISDLHAPFSHPDAVDFLRALNDYYEPDRIICLGDEIDSQALKYHERDPDLPSAGDELSHAVKSLQPIYDLFPRVDIVESNHTSLALRQARTSGIPRRYLREYRDVLCAPDGWKWHEELTITLPDGSQLYIHHGKNADPAKVAREYGMSVLQGHYHTEAVIKYASTPARLLWGMNGGCLIDTKSPAFHYNKNALKRPIIGTAMVINGLPQLKIMALDKKGRWTGKLP